MKIIGYMKATKPVEEVIMVTTKAGSPVVFAAQPFRVNDAKWFSRLSEAQDHAVEIIYRDAQRISEIPSIVQMRAANAIAKSSRRAMGNQQYRDIMAYVGPINEAADCGLLILEQDDKFYLIENENWANYYAIMV